MANNGSRYHAEVKVDIEGREARINVFADTLNEIFRDLATVTAQLPAGWMRPAKGEILNAERIAAQGQAAAGAPHDGPKVVMPTEQSPVCATCGSSDSMELIEFRSKKDGKLRRAWKCQECNEWHYPPGSRRK